jgi:hypothetical protein
MRLKVTFAGEVGDSFVCPESLENGAEHGRPFGNADPSARFFSNG